MSTTLSLDGDSLIIPTANDTSWDRNLNNTLSAVVNRLDETPNVVNVWADGAVGNGTTDDTSSIQAAINRVEAAGGGQVYFPLGQYLFTTLTLTANKTVWLVGEGWGHNVTGAGGSVLKHSGTGHGIVIGGTDADRTCDIRLLGLRLQGNGTETSSDAVRILRTHHAYMEGCRIWGWGGDGIELDRAYACSFVRNYINNNSGSGFQANGQNASILLFRNSFLSNTLKGVYFTAGDCDGTRILDNDFSGNGIGCQIDVGSSGAQSSAVVVSNNYAESQVGANFKFGTDAGTLWLDGFTFSGNNINSGAGSSAVNCVNFDRCRDMVVEGNYFGNCDVTVTSNTNGRIGVNGSGGTTVFPTTGWARMDMSASPVTRWGGALPKHELRSSGWDIRHRLGVNYSGDVYELGTNIVGTAATTGSLDDVAAAGSLIRLAGGRVEGFSATAGANPRTLTRLFVHDLTSGATTSGTATLVGGTVTVSTTAVKTGSIIALTRNTPGGTVGDLSAPVASIVNATSFVINSASGTDTSTINWQIVR